MAAESPPAGNCRVNSWEHSPDLWDLLMLVREPGMWEQQLKAWEGIRSLRPRERPKGHGLAPWVTQEGMRGGGRAERGRAGADGQLGREGARGGPPGGWGQVGSVRKTEAGRPVGQRPRVSAGWLWVMGPRRDLVGREGGPCWEGWGTIQEQVLEVAGLVR